MNRGFTNDERNLFFFFIFAMFIGTGLLLGGSPQQEELTMGGMRIPGGLRGGRIPQTEDRGAAGKKAHIPKTSKISKKSARQSRASGRGSGKVPSNLAVSSRAAGDGDAEGAGRRRGLKKAEIVSFPIDINLCSREELLAVPGIGPGITGALLTSRERGKRIHCIEELAAVPGVGLRRADRFASYFGLNSRPAEPMKIRVAAEKPMAFSGAETSHRVDLNRATLEELVRVKGIGRVLAQRIIAWRQERGPFRNLRELELVKGVSRRITLLAAKYLSCSESMRESVSRLERKAVIVEKPALAMALSCPETTGSTRLSQRVGRQDCWNWREDYRRLFKAFPELNR